MTDPRKEPKDRLVREIHATASRKLKARRRGPPPVWLGLGMMGLVGWSVVVPTLAGAALGVWLDRNHPSDHPWTLALLIAGLTLGCLNAWIWIAKEDRRMAPESEDDDA